MDQEWKTKRLISMWKSFYWDFWSHERCSNDNSTLWVDNSSSLWLPELLINCTTNICRTDLQKQNKTYKCFGHGNKVVHRVILGFSLLRTVPLIHKVAKRLDQPWKHRITLQTLTTMVTFLTTGQFTFMATDQGQGGEIGKAHVPSYLWATYSPTLLKFLPMGYLLTYLTQILTYGLPTYLRVLIGHLLIYPWAI